MFDLNLEQRVNPQVR